jgi:hypothetical protein
MLLSVLMLALPISMVSTRLSQALGVRSSWKAALIGCPKWMRLVVLCLFAYTALGLIAQFLAPAEPKHTEISVAALRTFSSFWMLFFFVGFAVSFSAMRSGHILISGRARNK